MHKSLAVVFFGLERPIPKRWLPFSLVGIARGKRSQPDLGGRAAMNAVGLTMSRCSALSFGMASADKKAWQPSLAGEARGGPSDGNGPDLTALALAARTREPAAMRRFLDALAPSVRSVCRGVLGASHVDLEDTIQDCLLAILRALPKYRLEGAVLHYTNRIALRHSIAVRKRGRYREQRARDLASQVPAITTSGKEDSLPDLWFLRDIIDELPEAQAEAVLMRMVFGYSMEEMAIATQVSVNTCKSRLRAGKDYLRVRLDQETHSSAGRMTHEP
jgi:RNA polymerase sigma-70 factor, ECF subfamily